MLQAALHRGPAAAELTIATEELQYDTYLSMSLDQLWPPGLWKPVAGAHSHSRQTVDHFLHRGLVRKVEHD